MEKLDKNVEEDLKVLTNFTIELYDVYDSLMALELDGKNNTPEFKKLVERAIQITQMTSTIEQRISTNQQELKKVIMNLYEELGVEFRHNELRQLKGYCPSKDKAVKMRLANDLNRFYSTYLDEEKAKSNISPAERQIMKYYVYFGERLGNNIDTMMLAKIVRENKLIAKIQEKGSGNVNLQNIKAGLCTLKYDTIFVNGTIEKYYLESGFTVEENPYIIKNGIHRLAGISDTFDSNYKIQLFLSVLDGFLSEFVYNDIEIEQHRLLVIKMLGLSYTLSSVLSLADSELIVETGMNNIKQLISKFEEIKGHDICKRILQKVIDDYELDKSSYQFISFGGR